MKPIVTISILVGYEYMLNLPLFSYHTYVLISNQQSARISIIHIYRTVRIIG